MCGGGDIQAEGFLVTGRTKDNGVVLSYVSRLGLATIGEDKGNGIGFGATRKVVVVREFVINKTTLSSTVYHCSSRHPPFRFRVRCLDVHIDKCQGRIFGC